MGRVSIRFHHQLRHQISDGVRELTQVLYVIFLTFHIIYVIIYNVAAYEKPKQPRL